MPAIPPKGSVRFPLRFTACRMSASDIAPTGRVPPPAEPRADRVGPRRSHATMRTILALILREMSTRYGRSPGGYAWALLEPIGGIIVMGFGLSLLLRVPPLGTSFLLFFATGLLPFNLYQNVSLMVSRALNFSKPLLAYPTVTWLDALLARFILNALTGIIVTVVVLALVVTVSDTRTLIDLPLAVGSVGLILLVGLGVGVLNCALIGLIQVWEMVWSIITRPLFFASGIFFLFDDLPATAQNILWYNPLIHVLGMMREAFYPTYSPNYVSAVYVIGVSIAMIALGVLLLYRYHLEILSK